MRYDALRAASGALMNKAMNPALKDDLEKRGVKCAHPAHKLFSQKGGRTAPEPVKASLV